MRILHTADWHVGKTLRGRSRLEESRAVLAELAELADARDVDVVLVAGDLFDSGSPQPEAEQIVYRGLLELAGGHRAVFVIAGNHDSPRRLAAVAPLLALAGVRLQPLVAAPADGGVAELTVRGVALRLALLPWLSQRYVVAAQTLFDADAAEHQLLYAARVQQVITALCASMTPDTVNIALGHLHVLGGVLGGDERAAHTVFDYAVPAATLPAVIQYLALGHLHRTQRIDAPVPTWYPGSPLALDFGEVNDDKSALIVELEPGRPARVEPVPLRSGRPLLILQGDVEGLARRAAEGVGDAWLQVVVTETRRAGLAEEVRALFGENVVDVRLADPAAASPVSAGRVRHGRSPADLFAEYLTERKVSDPRLERLFAELVEQAAAAPADGLDDAS